MCLRGDCCNATVEMQCIKNNNKKNKKKRIKMFFLHLAVKMYKLYAVNEKSEKYKFS